MEVNSSIFNTIIYDLKAKLKIKMILYKFYFTV